jgi:hypothetical protein
MYLPIGYVIIRRIKLTMLFMLIAKFENALYNSLVEPYFHKLLHEILYGPTLAHSRKTVYLEKELCIMSLAEPMQHQSLLK